VSEAREHDDLAADVANLDWLEALYLRHRRGEAGVPAAWRARFEALAAEDGARERRAPARARSRLGRPVIGTEPVASPHALLGGDEERLAKLQDRVDQLVRAYRVRGHAIADLDPLDRPRPVPDELELCYYGFTESDLGRRFSCDTLPEPHERTLGEILEHLRETYARTIGVQFMHIADGAVRRWLIDRMEAGRNRTRLDARTQHRIVRMLTLAISWETFVRKKFVGAKSFSLEGSETLLPLLDLAFEGACARGVREVVLAMAHRGRLNAMVNLLRTPPREVLASFLEGDATAHEGGDVRYHLGASADLETASGPLHVSLCFNPSHLESVGPVALGRTRAKQDRAGDAARERGMAVVVHGDAAFMGQGVAFETLNLSGLEAYTTGGTLHVVLNNQIGFTTSPEEGRSSPYAADVARFLQVPLFHVNGEDPEAVAQVVELALDFRQRFGTDVVIDMYGLRRLGHNEIDEPAITQPVMARLVRERESVRERYLRRLATLGGIDEEQADAIESQAREHLERELAAAREGDDGPADADADEGRGGTDGRVGATTRRGGERENAPANPWDGYRGGPVGACPEPRTAVPAERLRARLLALGRAPDDFELHRIVERLLEARRAMADGRRALDWGTAETLAYATLAEEGVRVRLTGQDTERGTFGHRHAALLDQRDGRAWRPLEHVARGQAPVEIRNSPLSEAAVVGFEYGYSLDAPDALVLWEAQFGDFVNGAQVVVDQFLAAAEDKWRRLSGLVLLLPHGFEGQGPEHSSARLERFLSLSAEDNIQVAVPSTPAQLFHLLRRQALWRWRKPLVVLTPKSLLRSARCTSSIEALAEGRFEPVLPDPREGLEAAASRVVLCGGKLFHELDEQREARELDDVALVRIEQLHPFPARQLNDLLATVGPDVPLVWAQEEPANMGAWRWLRVVWPSARRRLVGVTRPASASPATGSPGAHALEQREIHERALVAPLPSPSSCDVPSPSRSSP